MAELPDKKVDLVFVLSKKEEFPKRHLVKMVWELFCDLEPVDQALEICEIDLSTEDAAIICEAICKDAIRKGLHPASSNNFFMFISEVNEIAEFVDKRYFLKAEILRAGFSRMRQSLGYSTDPNEWRRTIG